MKLLSKSILVAAISFAPIYSIAQEQAEVLNALKMIETTKTENTVYRQNIKAGLEKKGEIIGIKELPSTKLYFVEAEYGSYIVSGDGRFVFDGVLKDVWHRKTLAKLTDLDRIDRVPVTANMQTMIEKLATFTLGDKKRPRSGVIFIDPTSEITITALQSLALKLEHNWLVVLLPNGGTNSLDRGRRLWCADDKDQALLDLVNGTNESFDSLRKDCPQDPLITAQLMISIFNVKSLPHMIREDGLVSEGFPIEFDKWFAQD
jgi:thiol:disulfide interchange protein DsbC